MSLAVSSAPERSSLQKHSEGALKAVDTEVVAKPQRRNFPLAYKRSILEAVDAAKHGEIGVILRREGLTYNHLVLWRQQFKRTELEPVKRGRKPKSELERELEQLRLAHAKLESENQKLQLIVEYQKKLASLMRNPSGKEDA